MPESKSEPNKSLDIPSKAEGIGELLANTDPLWTTEDVAAYLRLEPETIREMARRGEIPGHRFGKVWRFRSGEIRKLARG